MLENHTKNNSKWLPFEKDEWIAIRLMRPRDMVENKSKQIYELAEDAFADKKGLSLVESDTENPKQLRKALKKSIRRLKKLMPNFKNTAFILMIDQRLAHENEEQGKPIKLEYEKERTWHLRATDKYKKELTPPTSKTVKNSTDAKPGLIRFFDLNANEMSAAAFYLFMKDVEEKQKPTPSKKERRRLKFLQENETGPQTRIRAPSQNETQPDLNPRTQGSIAD